MSSTRDPDQPLGPEDLLDGRFVLERPLGRDAVAEVWRALDQELDRPVIVRRLHPALLDDAATLERFRLEALAAAQLNHGHVANVFDVTVTDEGAYSVGEYVDGPSLERLMQDGPLAPAVVAAVGHQAALGLAAAHDAGIVHRDVRPGNLLIGRDGRVRVVDFGSARIPDPDHEGYDDGAGDSRTYLAPEQLDPDVVGTDRSDVYALGRTLVRALDGLDGRRGEDRLIDRLMVAIPGLPMGTSLHELLREQLATATDPDPARRPSAHELAEALRVLHDRRADEVLRQLVGRLPVSEYGRRPLLR